MLTCLFLHFADLDKRRIRWGNNGQWLEYKPLLRTTGPYSFGMQMHSATPGAEIEIVDAPDWCQPQT